LVAFYGSWLENGEGAILTAPEITGAKTCDDDEDGDDADDYDNEDNIINNNNN